MVAKRGTRRGLTDADDGLHEVLLEGVEHRPALGHVADVWGQAQCVAHAAHDAGDAVHAGVGGVRVQGRRRAPGRRLPGAPRSAGPPLSSRRQGRVVQSVRSESAAVNVVEVVRGEARHGPHDSRLRAAPLGGRARPLAGLDGTPATLRHGVHRDVAALVEEALMENGNAVVLW